jgi:uncharacterized damage-inducible protein DinB
MEASRMHDQSAMFRLLARYNRWQNANLFAAAATLDDAALRQDRGAFFGSILGTLNHIYWADRGWMNGFTDLPDLPHPIEDSPFVMADFDALRQERDVFDVAIITWADGIEADWLAALPDWPHTSDAWTEPKPHWVYVLHFFNHQTHHRGQVHAMLTAAGATPGRTDLPYLPEMAAALNPPS